MTYKHVKDKNIEFCIHMVNMVVQIYNDDLSTTFMTGSVGLFYLIA